MVKLGGSYSYQGNFKNEGKKNKDLEFSDSEYMNGVS